jgi:hypothetical protein
MPNKKQSARPAESGWLMATALLSLPALRIGIKRFGLTLSELEELCRYEAEFEMESQGLKGALPWRSDVVLSAGISKGPGEDENEWHRLEELCQGFLAEMESENKRRASKGKDGSSNPRKPFTDTILPSESLKVILGKSDSEYRWKLAKELRSRSAILGSALSARSKKQGVKTPGQLGPIIELSRGINRKKRAEVLREIAQRQEEIEAHKWRIAGLKKSLKNLPEKLG